jgi:hypothetical protein
MPRIKATTDAGFHAIARVASKIRARIYLRIQGLASVQCNRAKLLDK